MRAPTGVRFSMSDDQEDEAVWDQRTLDRVLCKVDQKHWVTPFDRDELVRDLRGATRVYQIWRDGLDLRPTSRQLRNRAQQIDRLCQRLLNILPKPDVVLMRSNESPDEPSAEAIFGQLMFQSADKLDVLDSTIIGLNEIRGLAAKLAQIKVDADKRKTANEWLIGQKLPMIYGRYFKTKPRGVSYTVGRQNPSGPAITFTLAVLEIMQVKSAHHRPFSAEGIVEIWGKEAKRR